MAGPRMIGIKDVINPYAELQESVSKVGDIYQNYEKDRRTAQLHNEQMAEIERKETARQYLQNYTPELGGGDFKGIDTETKKAMILEEGNILKNLAETGADPDEYRRVTGEFARRRAQLVTREAVTADVYNDLIRNHVDPAIAQNLAAIEGSKYESLEERFKNASAAAAAEREDVFKRAQIAIDSYEARNPGSRSTNPKTGERGLAPLTTSSGVLTYLKDHVSGPGFKIDANKAFEDINSAVDLINKDRAEKGEKQIALGDITPLIATSFVSSMGDNDVIYGDSGTWRQAIEKYIAANGTGHSGGISPATAAEQAAITAALTAARTDPNSRAEFFAKRVRSTYGDLYKNLKSAKVGDDGELQILGGTGNSGAAGGSRVPSTDTAAGTDSRIDGATAASEVGGDGSTDTPGGSVPAETPSPIPLPQELVEQRTFLQSKIDDLINIPEGERTDLDRYVLRNFQSQLKDVEEGIGREQSNPEIVAAYRAAMEAGPGSSVPKEIFTTSRNYLVGSHPSARLGQLRADIDSEIANYDAVKKYAELHGNRLDAFKAQYKITQLGMTSRLLDKRIERERLSAKTPDPAAGTRLSTETPNTEAVGGIPAETPNTETIESLSTEALDPTTRKRLSQRLELLLRNPYKSRADSEEIQKIEGMLSRVGGRVDSAVSPSTNALDPETKEGLTRLFESLGRGSYN